MSINRPRSNTSHLSLFSVSPSATLSAVIAYTSIITTAHLCILVQMQPKGTANCTSNSNSNCNTQTSKLQTVPSADERQRRRRRRRQQRRSLFISSSSLSLSTFCYFSHYSVYSSTNKIPYSESKHAKASGITQIKYSFQRTSFAMRYKHHLRIVNWACWACVRDSLRNANINYIRHTVYGTCFLSRAYLFHSLPPSLSLSLSLYRFSDSFLFYLFPNSMHMYVCVNMHVHVHVQLCACLCSTLVESTMHGTAFMVPHTFRMYCIYIYM